MATVAQERDGQQPRLGGANLAIDLHNAGLLAPDMPEPSVGSDGALLWLNDTVWIEGDEVAVYTDLPKSINWMTS